MDETVQFIITIRPHQKNENYRQTASFYRLHPFTSHADTYNTDPECPFYGQEKYKKSLNIPFFFSSGLIFWSTKKEMPSESFFYFIFMVCPVNLRNLRRICNSNSTFEIQIHIQIIKPCLNPKLFHI